MSKQQPKEKLIGPLKIEALANGGKGIARTDGRVVFVAGAFPGDRVRCRLTKIKKNYAEGEVAELLQPSPLRRTPPCPVADECGGCQWQQLPYAEQLKWKQQLFVDTLTRQVGADSSVIKLIVPSPNEFGYRSRVQVKCFFAPEGFITGFFRSKSKYVIGVERCPLMPDALNDLLVALRQVIAGSRFGKEIPQLDLSIGSDGKRRAVVHFLGRDAAPLSELLLPVAQKIGFDLAVQSGRKSNLQAVVGNGDLQIAVDDPEISLTYAAGGFAQINLAQNRALVETAVAAAELRGNENVLDLYCGMGNFSLPLARRARSVTGVEDYAPSIEMAKRNAADNRIQNVDFYAMPAEDALSRFAGQFDLLVLDPPRIGAYDVAKQLAEKPVPKIIYISCDPQTLARDLKVLLSRNYRLVSSQAFDMFPQTHHVESLSVLTAEPQ
ncbi:23S rRNA m(5)U-1939 methyltransferase [Malonomonas rubra DSM 5091]|uniref:23S rRNA m(5)U-1939 methyltransferase n=1 Tax=Malonomonas rubra DSM 5091 TaxID=1122189 RepID=A0A1M6B698_MALRU|nr:23S rRNA (uracil(1939)-C(5))-methyltransferase RlmD [Malonomonas rubra]SHI44261.1 23S rRNA m(5)U-1939 methyltransferase [Malonomonas rubra DSM 5091]